MSFIVGIDEVGRGPLAGPVSVGVAVVPFGLDVADAFQGLRDSKLMTEKARERVYALAEAFQKKGNVQFGVFSASAETIDQRGIEYAIFSCIARGLKKLMPDHRVAEIYLDGRLKAPPEYQQQAIIRGDSLIPAISLASVVAKVHRDHFMTSVAHPQYPAYNFYAHKGYGTASHISAIREHGTSSLHRRSFLSRILPDKAYAGTVG